MLGIIREEIESGDLLSLKTKDNDYITTFLFCSWAEGNNAVGFELMRDRSLYNEMVTYISWNEVEEAKILTKNCTWFLQFLFELLRHLRELKAEMADLQKKNATQ